MIKVKVVTTQVIRTETEVTIETDKERAAWYALLLSIVTRKSAMESLSEMGFALHDVLED